MGRAGREVRGGGIRQLYLVQHAKPFPEKYVHEKWIHKAESRAQKCRVALQQCVQIVADSSNVR